jgi:hypothetical protein
LFLSWARTIQPTSSHRISLRYIVILSIHLRLGFHSRLFPFWLSTNNLHASFSPPFVLHFPSISFTFTWASQFYFAKSKKKKDEAPRYAILSTLPSLHPSPFQIFSTAPCSQTPCLCSSLNIRDQVSHPYRTTRNIIALYILIFMVLDRRREGRRFWYEWYQKHYQNPISF